MHLGRGAGQLGEIVLCLLVRELMVVFSEAYHTDKRANIVDMLEAIPKAQRLAMAERIHSMRRLLQYSVQPQQDIVR
jgi:hypothetical protein